GRARRGAAPEFPLSHARLVRAVLMQALRAIIIAAALIAAGLLAASAAFAEARVKDVAHVLGIRDNNLYGYGLVIGLNGTGDKSKTNPFTPQAVANMLLRLGITVPPASLDGKNVA